MVLRISRACGHEKGPRRGRGPGYIPGMDDPDLPNVLNTLAVVSGVITAVLAAIAASWASSRKKGKRAAPSPSEDKANLLAHSFAIVTALLLLASVIV